MAAILMARRGWWQGWRRWPSCARGGITPPQDLTVVAFRAEEAAWFPLSYPGSLASVGLLPAQALQARRSDTGRTLADHMAAGFDPDAVAGGAAHPLQERVAAFVEVHIEQGPLLVGRGVALGIVTAINGGFRHTAARVRGEWHIRVPHHSAIGATRLWPWRT